MHVFIAWFCGPGCCALLSITSLPVLWGSMTQPQRGSGSCSLLSGTAGHLPFSHLLSCRQPPPQLPRICCRVQHTVGRGSVQSTPAAPLWGAHSAFCRVSETFSGFPCPFSPDCSEPNWNFLCCSGWVSTSLTFLYWMCIPVLLIVLISAVSGWSVLMGCRAVRRSMSLGICTAVAPEQEAPESCVCQ